LKKLLAEDAASSVNDIQLALFNRFPDEKFLVMCALAGDDPASGPKPPRAHAPPILPNKARNELLFGLNLNFEK
jgi:hypothetical protein